MTKQELWAQITAKNPSFDGNGNVTLSAAGLRKMFDLVWDKAYSSGFDNGKEIAGKLHKAAGNTGGSGGMDAFNSIFGNLGKK
jgi:hypothetical protein